ncbi:MAG TPA: PilW family protein [Gammaproteobacteria bacterium]|nr:PilW family protein [Gammaproteobacteria bacterium]
MTATPVSHHQHGLSLVELMVALVIGLILTAGVISVYLTSKRSYSTDTGIAQVQENGRFVLGFMEPVVRMAGFQGCVPPRSATPVSAISTVSMPAVALYSYQASGAAATDPTSATVVGYDASGSDIGDNLTLAATQPLSSAASDWSPDVDATVYAAIKDYALTGSDILLVHAASADTVPVVDNPAGSGTYDQSTGVYVAAADVAGFSAGDLAIISDCQKAALFQITGTSSGSGPLTMGDSSTPGNDAGKIGSNWTSKIGLYGQGSTVTVAQTYIFFIGLSETDKMPALFRVSLDGSGALNTPEELVPNIENMQLVYGVDTDADQVPERFVSADTVNTAGNWGRVVAVRIALISRSDDLTLPVAPPAAQDFDLDGTKVTVPLDRRLRKEFVQTIALRNMLQ